MTKPELELFDCMTPAQRALAEAYLRRLPPGELIAKPDLQAAFALHPQAVTALIECGELIGIDKGAGSRARWFITRQSAEAFICRRILGISSKRERSLS
ncbi:MAG: hypothetical protein ONB24_15265 [candidate division KSB1 bacterium]|nr:hypothetical protein [candidate division KSB1 bacterium]